MSVKIIDTLKPKNGGNFPIVEAIDVFVEGFDNLADAVTHFATDIMIDAINTVLRGKANTADVEEAVANLQGQINEIVISASSESVVAPEVLSARVGEDGTTYDTLKERIDTEVEGLKSRVNETAAFASTATTVIADLNDIKNTCDNMLVLTDVSVPDNLPSDYPLTGRTGILKVFKATLSGDLYAVVQRLQVMNTTSLSWFRIYNSNNGWSAWYKENVGTFRVKNNAVSAGGARDTLSDLNNAEADSKYVLMITSASVPDNLPSDYPINGMYATLESVKAIYSGSNYIIRQKLTSPNLSYFWDRQYNSSDNTWSAWYKRNSGVYFMKDKAIFNTAARSVLSDLNNAEADSKYMMMITSSSVPDNLPSDYPTNGMYATLETVKSIYSGSDYIIRQQIKSPIVSHYWDRQYNSSLGTWTPWRKINAGTFFVKENALFANTARTTLSNLNNAEPDTTYVMILTTASLPDNLPSDYPTNGMYAELETVKVIYSGSNYIIRQTIKSPILSYFWDRQYNSSDGNWTTWYKRYYYDASSLEITVGEGKQYERLRDGIAAGMARKGSTVVVYAGTYDLTEEFAEEIAAETGGQNGIALGNDITVKFMAGAYVTALCDNTSSWVYNNFSPFYTTGSYTLENANIKASNTRYCLHDEMSGSGTYKVHIKNCKMEYANTHSDISYVQCIGGGLGEHGYVFIEGGQYKCSTTVGIGAYGTYGTPNNCQQPISYHNGSAATCDGKIVIKDVYLADRGYFRFGNYGASTIKTPVEVNNCSTGLPIMDMYESLTVQNENFDICAYNNNVRNATVPFEFSRLINLIGT